MARFLAEQGEAGRSAGTRATSGRTWSGLGGAAPPRRARNRLTRAQAGLGPGDAVVLEGRGAPGPRVHGSVSRDVQDRSHEPAAGPRAQRAFRSALVRRAPAIPAGRAGRGCKVYFRINNGNIVQFGADRVAGSGSASNRPWMPRGEERGLDALGSSVARTSPETLDADRLRDRDPGGLTAGERPGEPHAGLAGSRVRPRALVWRSTVRLRSDDATVPAHGGRSGRGLCRARKASSATRPPRLRGGGSTPYDRMWATEVVKGLGFLAVTNGTPWVHERGGRLRPHSGGTASSTMERQVRAGERHCAAAPSRSRTARSGTLAQRQQRMERLH